MVCRTLCNEGEQKIMALLLRTPRLELVPLTAQELDMLVSDLPRLEKRLGVTYRGEPLNGAFGSIVKGQ